MKNPIESQFWIFLLIKHNIPIIFPFLVGLFFPASPGPHRVRHFSGQGARRHWCGAHGAPRDGVAGNFAGNMAILMRIMTII